MWRGNQEGQLASLTTRVDVVVWHLDKDASVRPIELSGLTVPDGLEARTADLVRQVWERTGLNVAVLRITAGVAHVELLAEPAERAIAWCEDDPAVIEPFHPWYRIGWYRRTSALVAEALSTLTIRARGPLRQRQHTNISAIASQATDDGVVWFKQVPPLMAHDGRLTQWIAELAPDRVPQVLATGPDWCLMREFDAPHDGPPANDPFGLLAEIQLAATPRAAELLPVGCPDRRPARLLSDLVALGDRDDLVDSTYRRVIDAIRPALQAAADTLAAGGLADSLIHGDLHSGNTRHTARGWLLYDWTDGALSHPFLDLGVLAIPREKGTAPSRLAAYRAVWAPHVPSDALDQMLAAGRLLGIAHQAITSQRIGDALDHGDRPGMHKGLQAYLQLANREVFGHFPAS
jgi:hypothetical protein